MVVQEYLKEPYLIDNLKFDMRLYVLITSCDPLKLFLFHEGIVRFATEEFFSSTCTKEANIDNMYIHLTNYSINKDNGGKFQSASSALDDSGHKRSFKTVLNRIKSQGVDTDQLMSSIKDIIVKTMMTIQPELAHNYRTCQPSDREGSMCFEILGFDIILDHLAKPYLLEVNHAPSFNTDTSLDYLVKKQLMRDTFTLLNINVEDKKQKLLQIHEDKQSRLRQKISLKQKIESQNQMLKERSKALEEYEALNLGGFERIYPSSGQKSEGLQSFEEELKARRQQREQTKQMAQTIGSFGKQLKKGSLKSKIGSAGKNRAKENTKSTQRAIVNRKNSTTVFSQQSSPASQTWTNMQFTQDSLTPKPGDQITAEKYIEPSQSREWRITHQNASGSDFCQFTDQYIKDDAIQEVEDDEEDMHMHLPNPVYNASESLQNIEPQHVRSTKNYTSTLCQKKHSLNPSNHNSQKTLNISSQTPYVMPQNSFEGVSRVTLAQQLSKWNPSWQSPTKRAKKNLQGILQTKSIVKQGNQNAETPHLSIGVPKQTIEPKKQIRGVKSLPHKNSNQFPELHRLPAEVQPIKTQLPTQIVANSWFSTSKPAPKDDKNQQYVMLDSIYVNDQKKNQHQVQHQHHGINPRAQVINARLDLLKKRDEFNKMINHQSQLGAAPANQSNQYQLSKSTNRKATMCRNQRQYNQTQTKRELSPGLVKQQQNDVSSRGNADHQELLHMLVMNQTNSKHRPFPFKNNLQSNNVNNTSAQGSPPDQDQEPSARNGTLNFTNCNLTIINNNHYYNIYPSDATAHKHQR